MLRSAQLTTMSDRELSAVLAKLPRRAPLRPVVSVGETPDNWPGASGADDAFTTVTRRDDQQAAESALQRALERLETEDRLLLRLLFWSGLTVAEAARALAIPQKPLYRRLPRLLDSLRTELEAAGFTTEHIRWLIAEDGD
jgi:DNA-directed RNA polymerase specialized sigma24 family protein